MKRAVVVFLAFGLSFPQVPARSEVDGVIWPKAPFVPHLIHVASGSEQLCARYEHEAIKSHFEGFFSPETVSAEMKEMAVVEPISLSKLSSLKYAGFSSLIYEGDWDGDGLIDYIFALRTGGGNRTNYRYYHQFVELTSERLQILRDDLKAIAVDADGTPYQEIHRLFLALQKELTLAARPRPRKSLPVGRAAYAVEQAYSLVDSMRVRSHKGRLYADVLVPDAEKTDRVLLSYDAEMRPKAECVVAVKADLKTVEGNPWSSGALSNVLLSYRQTLGARRHCDIGSSRPFLYRRWGRDHLLYESLFRPWSNDSLGRLREKALSTLKHQMNSSGSDNNWDYVPYNYFWSLESPFNRRSYNRSQRSAKGAIQELSSYYGLEFKLADSIATTRAGLFVHALRLSSASGGDHAFGYSHDADGLIRIREGTAIAGDFVDLAGMQRDEFSNPLVSADATEIPVLVYTIALALAIGAQADESILTELIAMGAEIDGGDTPPIIHAVDNRASLDLLLGAGAKPDAPNGFGKTALMMASHLDEADAVKTLLSAGANPNRKTWKKLPDVEDRMGRMRPDCRYTALKFRERTPLMYAAENASLQVIRLLLDAGADKSAVDTGGRNVLDYLAMNRLLTAREGKKAKRMLAGD